MGKKRSSVIELSSSSSSDGDDWRDRRGRRRGESRSEPPQPRPTTTSRKRPRGGRSGKGITSSSSGSVLRSSARGVEPVKFGMLSADFSECLNVGSKVAGFTFQDGKELWFHKHKPLSSRELAVHRKKVQEVKVWLENRLNTSKDTLNCCTLLITGQAGTGKSTTIKVLASELGAELYEWTTPIPTLWQEHVHSSGLGLHYISKLDEFENFIEKIRKYSLLGPTSTGRSHNPVILLIDDLPATNGRTAFVRLNRCLTVLTQTTQIPTVILITKYCTSESGENPGNCLEDLESSLEKAGAYKVAFNPLTANSIKKVLCKISQEENCNINTEVLNQIAESSGGDIRHAIMSLQFCCLRPILPAVDDHIPEMKTKELAACLSSAARREDQNEMMLSFGRDESLSLFHALGKFLHNKRETAVTSSGSYSFLLQERLTRNPLKMDTPERILSQAHAQARTITDFLHENVLDFLSDDAIDDSWLVTSYLSDSDCILASASCPRWPKMMTDKYESESLAQSVAGSIAVRGVLFGNSMPSTRWHAIRRPRLWQIDQSFRRNKHQVMMDRIGVYTNSISCDSYDIVTEYRPRNKWLISCIYNQDDRTELMRNSNQEEVEFLLKDLVVEETEDEIED